MSDPLTDDSLTDNSLTDPFGDTHPDAAALQLAIMREMPIWRKMAVIESLNETVKALALSGLRARHPDATPEQLFRLYAELRLGAELARKVYGDAR